MKLRKPALFLLMFSLGYFNLAEAQEGNTYVVSDLETWSSIKLKYKLDNGLSFNLSQGLRFNTNSTLTDQVLTEIGFKYTTSNKLSLASDFRYIADRGGDGLFDNDFRFNIDLGFKHKLDRFELKYRLRYQNRNEIGYSYLEGDDFENVIRLKLGINYNIKSWKLDPELSTELFRDVWSDQAEWYKIRLTLSTDYTLKRVGNFSPFYRIEQDLFEAYPKTTYIFGLNYTYTIKQRK